MHAGETVLDKISRECLIRQNLKDIPFVHYFSNDFMERNTQYFCIEDFMKSIGVFDINTLEQVDQDSWDSIVNQTTVFKDWNEMLNDAGSEYYQLHMQKGLAI
ncbi:hypothetical protein [Companilactobacillus jidongensis]|uniref:hypothetical protein n=1 Tax=Companilactobacillus jidongensis TaxID=2486006 RepID=UPI000F7A72E7|nr:hypothetical protein [Companilactobacillus jidongensis]